VVFLQGIGNFLVDLTQTRSIYEVGRSSDSGTVSRATIGRSTKRSFQNILANSSVDLCKATTHEAVEAFFKSVIPPEQAFHTSISLTELQHLLRPLSGSFFCNITHLEDIVTRPLSLVLVELLYTGGIIQRLKLDLEALFCFALEIEDNYQNNPYHNRLHAAFVVHRTYVAIQKLNLDDSNLSHMSWKLAALVGAAVHDVLHPGVNNAHAVKTEANVALKFNDQAVLENESLQLTINLLRADQTNFIKGSDLAHSKRWRQFKSNLISVVLATDMSSHFRIVSTFQQKVSSLGVMHPGGPFGGTEEQLEIAVQMVVKMADIGHCTARMAQHYYWSQCLEDEFFAQGDQEKAEKLDVSPLMDRTKPGVMFPKNQIGFFKVILLPLHEAFTAVFPAMLPVQHQGQINLQHWQERAARAVEDEPRRLLHYKAAMVQQFEKDRTLTDPVCELDGVVFKSAGSDSAVHHSRSIQIPLSKRRPTAPGAR